MRWYRRRSQNRQALIGGGGADTSAQPIGPDGGSGPNGPRGPAMSHRGGLAPVLAPLLGGAIFKSRQQAESGPQATGERGFQRVSGRKLPSAFSPGIEGLTSPPPMPVAFENDRDMNRSSAYRDSTGYYGGEGPFSDPDDHNFNETFHPGPARQPTLHHGGPYSALPTSVAGSPLSPTFRQSVITPIEGRPSSSIIMDSPGTANRSATPATLSSFDGSRGSRFTEEV